jgi:hypothetical protein
MEMAMRQVFFADMRGCEALLLQRREHAPSLRGFVLG